MELLILFKSKEIIEIENRFALFNNQSAIHDVATRDGVHIAVKVTLQHAMKHLNTLKYHNNI